MALGGAMSMFVPVADITKRYRPEDAARNRKKALRILLIWYAAAAVGAWWSPAAAAKISITLNAVAVMVLMTKPWKRGDYRIR